MATKWKYNKKRLTIAILCLLFRDNHSIVLDGGGNSVKLLHFHDLFNYKIIKENNKNLFRALQNVTLTLRFRANCCTRLYSQGNRDRFLKGEWLRFLFYFK